MSPFLGLDNQIFYINQKTLLIYHNYILLIADNQNFPKA